MAVTYKLTDASTGGMIVRTDDDGRQFWIPPSPGNADYQAFLAWDALPGNDAAAADPEPLRYAGRQDREYRVQTVGTAPQELLRIALAPTTVYSAFVLLEAIDTVNGAVKSWYFKSDFKRLANGALAVGARQDITPPAPDTGAAAVTAGVASWAITPSLAGNDAVISVTGAAGRTVAWFAFLTLRQFAPGGQP